MKRYLILGSDAQTLCGVEAFARGMADRLGSRADFHVLDFGLMALSKALDGHDGIVINFPIVAWKKRIIEPLAAAMVARLRRKTVTVVLHEWASLDWKRRLALWPVLQLADAVLFSAPEIRDEWHRAFLSGRGRKPSALVPIPPNLVPSEPVQDGPAASQIRKRRKAGETIVGQFGSIYPRKNCAELLDVVAALPDNGRNILTVFVGSFIKGTDNIEQDFENEVRKRNLDDRVFVTGYIGSNEEVFAALREVDVFCYKFIEGLTSRRGSVLAAALSGRVVVTNAPRHPAALDHHKLFRTLIANGNIVLCPTDADVGAMAAAVGRAIEANAPQKLDLRQEMSLLWEAIVARLDDVQR